MPGGSPQTLRPFLWRAQTLYPDREVVSRTHQGVERYDYGEYDQRARRLASALDERGLAGERVGTVCWNHHRHFETYFGVPLAGAQLHTINPLLPEHHLEYIVDDAGDRLLFVDPSLVETVEAVADTGPFGGVEYVVMGDGVPDTSLEPVTDYESFLSAGDPDYEFPDLDEDRPAGMCYTSGTTGRPKGVEYTHQMLWAHTMATLPSTGLDLADSDVLMPVVPMFHVNAWGMPFSATAVGAKHVYPGPAPDPADLAGLIEDEGVTVSAGVPTVWLGLLEYLEENDADLSTLDRVVIGGSAAPESLVRTFEEDLGVDVVHAWGMTETSPIGTVANRKTTLPDDEDTHYDVRTSQGIPVPGLETKVVDDDGEELPWDGESVGELLVRGPWVTTEYHDRPDADAESFEDGWLRTGDVVTIDGEGYLDIVDRTDDVIKSGGEWISSVELENAIMAHDQVREAAVVGVDDERWGERPVAFLVATEGADHEAVTEEVLAAIGEDYPTWWRPDGVEFVDEIPKTATGKFSKRHLREQHADPSLARRGAPEDAAPDAE
jgi:fatty-acyl-CoA synthase